jgi:hypothetical protein
LTRWVPNKNTVSVSPNNRAAKQITLASVWQKSSPV